ncbi:MAG: sensor histidine kinase [Oscillospiraceae bacterium]|jgi:signal transduction histidine kinase|nr:sensor histidine kinase [Oscillospiraceae bacterium]
MAEKNKNNLKTLRGLFGAMPQAVVALADGGVVYLNAAAERLLPALEAERPSETFPETFIGTEPSEFTSELLLRGERYTVIGAMMDDVRVLSLYPPARDDAEEGDRALHAVAGGVRKPLSALRLAFDFALPAIDALENTKISLYSAMMYHSFYELLRISSHLDIVADALNATGRIEPTGFDLTALCRRLTETARHLAQTQDTAAILFEARERSLPFRGDSELIESMVLNLLCNALAFTPKGGEVFLIVSRSGNNALITVRDTGVGIPPERQQTVWARYAYERDVTDAKAGPGFGLTVVQHVARLHGGFAVLESALGRGTTVTVSIPLAEKNELRDAPQDVLPQGVRLPLTELSPILGSDKYLQRYLD